MSTILKQKKIVIIVVILICACAAFAVYEVLWGHHIISEYKVNENGQTYGKMAENSNEEPDLIETTASNGKTGYIKATDIDKYGGGDINSLEEAKKYMKNDKPVRIPVYKSDGESVIGYFYLDGYIEEK